MKVSVACRRCRQRKNKCIHNGTVPCKSCKIRGMQSTCQLYSTQEFRKIKKSLDIPEAAHLACPDISDSVVTASVKSAAHHYPELLFLSSLKCEELVKSLDELVISGLCALNVPFNPPCAAAEKEDRSLSLEMKLLTKIDAKPPLDLVTILQASILILILNWQNGKTHKGHLLGGFAERAYMMLGDENYERKSLKEREFRIRTLWSYQLITLPLKKGSWKEYKSRLYRFQLPRNNYDILFEQALNGCFLKDLKIGSESSISSLFIAVTALWADCSSWVIQGGRQHFKEAPWDESSEWHRLNQKILHFECHLGPKYSLNVRNLNAFFTLGQGSMYCNIHFALLISRILIHRDYMPFVPVDDEGPKGPLDSTILLKDSPPNWWEKSASTVFESARKAALIYEECRKRNLYSCTAFGGFVALTCSSMLFYIYSFPSFNPEFRDAEVYYDYCVSFLKYYKSHWELGSYYYQFLGHTVNMFENASNNQVTYSNIAVFENMKKELVDIANFAAPINSTNRIQIENLIELSDESTYKSRPEDFASKLNQKTKDALCSLMGWDSNWLSFANTENIWAT